MCYCTPASASRSDHKTGSAYIVVGSLVTEPPTHESIKVGTRLETDYSTHVGAIALSKRIATHPRTDVLITSARSAETKRHVQIVCTLRPRIPAASCREFPHCLQAKASCREFQGNRAAYCTLQLVRRLPCSSPVIYYYHYPCLSLPIITYHYHYYHHHPYHHHHRYYASLAAGMRVEGAISERLEKKRSASMCLV